ncbi:MAG: NUDIX hydrolase [Hyphomicrobiales bacterium]|nr:NUDIX hydrolase [Hyphomicrobiales bacterium]
MRPRQQYAALPFVAERGDTQILLITSRDTGRWIVPKGWPEDGVPPHDLAALEAFEEAGLKGRIGRKPIGHYRYRKLMEDGSSVDCEVDVFPMQVEHLADEWPEQKERRRKWVTAKKAAELVAEEDLKKLIKNFKPGKQKL